MRGFQALKICFEGMKSSDSSQTILRSIASLSGAWLIMTVARSSSPSSSGIKQKVCQNRAQKFGQEESVPLIHSQTDQDLGRNCGFLHGSWGISGTFSWGLNPEIQSRNTHVPFCFWPCLFSSKARFQREPPHGLHQAGRSGYP